PLWRQHLLSLDHPRQGTGLRAYAQKDPLNESKSEAFGLFDAMLTRLREAVTGALCHLEIQAAPAPQPSPVQQESWRETRADPATAPASGPAEASRAAGTTTLEI